MPRRLLIVSPHFVPVNAPDMHRVRLALPYFAKHDWEVTVLAIAPEMIEGVPLDEHLRETIPANTTVHTSRGIPYQWTRRFGVGSLWLRCGRAFARMAEEHLRRENYDLAFISTSQFDAFSLGPLWRSRHGLPYVLDFQDPWVTDYFETSDARPPGGRLKYGISQLRARRREPAAVRGAGGIVCVSSDYGPALHKRYPGTSNTPLITLPFGASTIDLDLAQRTEPTSLLVPFGDENIHHVYTGRVTPNMRSSLDILFLGFRKYLDSCPNEANRHRFHFIGTDYAPASLAQFNVLPAANEAGVQSFVSEFPARVPYFEALHYLTRAHSIIVLGSDDEGYTASKLNPCLLVAKPLLLIAHARSPMYERAMQLGLDSVFGFHSTLPDELETRSLAVKQTWFQEGGFLRPPPASIRGQVLDAESMTDQLVELFEQARIRAR